MQNDNQSGDEEQKGAERKSLSPEEIDLQEIACALRSLPDQRVPDAFTDMVMANLPVACKRKNAWKRFVDWAKSPHTITYSPLKIAPAFALAAVLLLLSVREKVNLNTADVRQDADGKQVVSFVFHSPQARTVAVVGSFNEWAPNGTEMRRLDNGPWVLTLPLSTGRYRYVFLVDEKFIEPDPGAVICEDDGFGSRNSVIIVGKNNGTSI